MSLSTLKGRKVDVHLWTPIESVESSALDQLRNIAALPWVFHHVAAMPDVHYGKGATVGSVIAMKGAVSPAAVGVDIGCFTADTRVPVASGRDVAISDLVRGDEEPIVYSCTPTGRIVMARATARRTRSAAALVAVVLDNGERIRCTPDHEF